MKKKEVKKAVCRFKAQLDKIMKSEKNIVYNGNDDEFSDLVSHFYGDLINVVESADDVLDA